MCTRSPARRAVAFLTSLPLTHPTSLAAGSFTGMFFLESFFSVLPFTQRNQFGLAVLSAMSSLGLPNSAVAETRFVMGQPRTWTSRKEARMPQTIGGTLMPFTLSTSPASVGAVSQSLIAATQQPSAPGQLPPAARVPSLSVKRTTQPWPSTGARSAVSAVSCVK